MIVIEKMRMAKRQFAIKQILMAKWQFALESETYNIYAHVAAVAFLNARNFANDCCTLLTSAKF